MLEGLEISEVMLSELDYSSRIDAEYYKKSCLAIEDIIESKKHYLLAEIAEFLIGPFGSAFDTDNYVEKGNYRYVRGQDVKPFILKDEDCRYIPEDDYYRLYKYALKDKDVLVSVVGTLGNACIVQEKDLPAIFSCKSTVIRANAINPVVLLTYLNCKYGRELLLRKERGAIQKGLNLDDLRTLIIPAFDNEFSKVIETLFYTAQNHITKSKSLYSKAEGILLSELGLQSWQPNNYPINIKQLKESFLASGRLDAEYYQQKYEDYYKFIRQYKGGSDTLANICSVNDENYNPLDDSEYKYIELSNIGNSGEITGCTTSIGAELPSRARRLVHTNDVVVSSIEGSLQSVALVTDEYDKAICSTGFYVVNSNSINPETLLVLFKSEPMQNLLKQGCSGTILTAIGRTEFQNLAMPKIRKEVQTEIAEYVQKSMSLRGEAKQLLENAKLKVESEIANGGGI